jgi:hypothetical protein
MAVQNPVNVIPRELFGIPVLSIAILLSNLPLAWQMQSTPPSCALPLATLQISTGAEAKIPGLYFCGFHVAPTGMLREIRIEARRISKSMAGKKMQ